MVSLLLVRVQVEIIKYIKYTFESRAVNKKISTPLIRLFHYRWAAPILAALHNLSGGAKLITLQNRLEVNRTTLRRTLDSLIEKDLVCRNPGYGHPMRPEYLLTDRGARIAPTCQALLQRLNELGLKEVGLNKWSLPMIEALPRSGGRFNALKGELKGITARALAQCLKSLIEEGLVERALIDDHPPWSEYSLTQLGQELNLWMIDLIRDL